MQWASEKNVAEAVLSRRPGVLEVDANRWHRPPRLPMIPTKPRWRSWPAGYEIVVTTVPASRFPSTSAIPWQSQQTLQSMIIFRRAIRR